MEKELMASKRFNKAAIVIIIVMLVLMSLMAVDMRCWADKYEGLERKYEELYEELKGSGKLAFRTFPDIVKTLNLYEDHNYRYTCDKEIACEPEFWNA